MSWLRSFLDAMQKRRKALLYLLAIFLGNGLVFVGVTHRLATKQERLASERELLTFELQQKKAELDSITLAETRSASNAAAVERFWDQVVKERSPGLTEAWDEIDRLASEANVVRGRTGYDREILDVGLERIKATMPVEGSYFDLVRFINHLERSERFFLVEGVRLSQRESDDQAVELECSIAFYLRPSLDAEASGS
jgi:hypothetical protein